MLARDEALVDAQHLLSAWVTLVVVNDKVGTTTLLFFVHLGCHPGLKLLSSRVVTEQEPTHPLLFLQIDIDDIIHLPVDPGFVEDGALEDDIRNIALCFLPRLKTLEDERMCQPVEPTELLFVIKDYGG